eukprot:scaffold67233_cov45-Phaeocystis_antarctica.AAC.1
MVQLRVPIGKPTVVLYAPLPAEEQPTPEARAAELVAREDIQDSGALERWLHETWDLWHFTGVVNERTEAAPSYTSDPGPSPSPYPYQVRGGTFVHLAVNAERLAALARLGREEALEQHDLWLLSVAKAHELTLDAALATLQRGGGGLKSDKAQSRPGVQALWRPNPKPNTHPDPNTNPDPDPNPDPNPNPNPDPNPNLSRRCGAAASRSPHRRAVAGSTATLLTRGVEA